MHTVSSTVSQCQSYARTHTRMQVKRCSILIPNTCVSPLHQVIWDQFRLFTPRYNYVSYLDRPRLHVTDNLSWDCDRPAYTQYAASFKAELFLSSPNPRQTTCTKIKCNMPLWRTLPSKHQLTHLLWRLSTGAHQLFHSPDVVLQNIMFLHAFHDFYNLAMFDNKISSSNNLRWPSTA